MNSPFLEAPTDTAFKFWLYLYGSVFGGMAYTAWDGILPNPSLEVIDNPLATEPIPFTNIVSTAAIIVSTTATGIVVATILRKKDNLVKLVGSSASIVTIAIAQCFLFTNLRERTLTPEMIIGIGTIAISTWTYHYYKELQPEQQYLFLDYGSSADSEAASTLVDSSNSDSEELGFDEVKTKSSRRTPTPTSWRILLVAFCISGLALIAGLRQSWQLTRGNTEGFDAFNLPIADEAIDSAATHSPLLHATPTGIDDIHRYFVPHNITPSAWGQTNTPYNCISDWVEREKIYPVSAKFTDWENTFIKSGCPIYPIPKGGVLFHQFWSGKWRPFNVVNIEAWLATQRLGDGHRLIYWYDNGEPPKSVLNQFRSYADYVEFRKFDRVKEAEGTCVADMPEWDPVYQKANKMQVATVSDITRNLLLAKYGGVWLDSDTIPMRDLTPLLRSGPSAGGVSPLRLNLRSKC
jgi:hypothetical protein